MSDFWLIPWLLLLSAAAAWATGWGLRRADRSQEAQPPGERLYDRKQAVILGGLLLVLSAGLCLVHRFVFDYGVFDTLVRAFLMAWLTAAACIDGKRRIIPLWLTRFGAAMGLVYLLLYWLGGVSLRSVLLYGGLGMLLGGGVFLICSLLSRGGMGMGDVRLFAVLGLFFGWQRLIALMFYTVLGIAVYGIAQLIRKKLDKRTTIPIGPFALIGLALTMLLGN